VLLVEVVKKTGA